MDRLKLEVRGMGWSIEVKGGGNEREVRNKPGNITDWKLLRGSNTRFG